MTEKSFMDLYLSVGSLFRRMVDIGEWVVIFVVGFLLPHPKIPFFPFSNVIGAFLLLIGIWMHKLSHRVHIQAHQEKGKIEALVTTDGIYSQIRHPIYMAYIICYFGVLFLFGSLSMLVPILIFSYIFYHSAITEEKFLIKKFGKKYEVYMKKVPWRFLPKIF